MLPFQYRQISRQLISELGEMALRKESAVLLGPRYCGKRYLMSHVYDYLLKENIYPTVKIDFLELRPVITEQKARDLIHQAVIEIDANVNSDEPSSCSLFESIARLSSRWGKPIVLLASNVDAMAHQLARVFLQGVRSRVEMRELIVVLSGEDDFRDLVHGPNSEFTCSNQFVIQQCDEDEFNRYLERCASIFLKESRVSQGIGWGLWEYTGGNIYLLRKLLSAFAEGTISSNGDQVHLNDITDLLNDLSLESLFETPIFRNAVETVSKDPACWSVLEKLIRGEVVRIEIEDNPPTRLELAGVAIRKDSRLWFASKLMEAFVKHHYDDLQFGDLYVSRGDWEKAFERYVLLSPEERMRPSGINDKVAIEAAVNALCAALHSEAAKGIESVKKLFIQGCRYLLGFGDITFWQSSWAWKPVTVDCLHLNHVTLDQIANLLPDPSSLQPGPLQLQEPLDKCSVAAILPAVDQDEWGAVIIGDFEKRTVISRERLRLAEKVIAHFNSAYSHAVNVKRTEKRLRVRDQHIQIITLILDALGSEVNNAREVITMAAGQLRKLGYRRVLFCLVDPERKRIQGVLDDSDDKSVDVAKMTDWPLDNPHADLQPHAIYTRKPKIVADARLEPLANLFVVDKTKMKSEAIVPILNPYGEAIGTIHIERADGTVPRPDEVADLLQFGRQLAVVIEQSERVDMLQSALDKIPEPVLIVDSLEKTRYANKKMGELIGMPAGWQSRIKAEQLSGPGTDQIVEYLRKTLEDGFRRVRHFEGIGNNPNYRGAVLCDKIQDWRGKNVGALLHIEDLNYFYQILEAFRYIAEATDTWSAMQSMLQAMKELGHDWGRLYVLDEQDEERLISKLYFGPMSNQDQEVFNRGEVVLQPRSNPNQMAWKCIDEGEPLVFCWDEHHANGKYLLTEQGLRVININPLVAPVQVRKKPADFWIDFPLFAEEKTLGKMTLQCNPDFRPEDFEMLKLFFVGLMDAVLRREREFERQTRMLQKTAQDTLGVTAHNITSRFGTLAALLASYRLYEKEISTIGELNDRFAKNLEKIGAAVRRMGERLGPLNIHRDIFDLVELMRQSLSSLLPEGKWTLSFTHPSIEVFWDYHLIDTVLTELIHNSRAFIPEDANIGIRVHLELASHGPTDQAKIVYSDNGPGVPSELKQRIFDEFFSLRPGQQRSTGIGLGFVRRVAQAHGGTVHEIGQYGEGAMFEIIIPRSRPAG